MLNQKRLKILVIFCITLTQSVLLRSETLKNTAELKSYKDHLIKIEESIQLTKEKIASPESTQYLPDMYYMLAELLTEKGNYLYILKKESNKGVPESELDLTAEKRAKADAIEAFKQLMQRYPNYKSIDKVLYVVGQELKAIGESDQALQYFKKSSEQYPNSVFAVKSFMEIGNIFYEKKDFDFALDQYLKASKKAQGEDLLLVFNKIASCYTYKELWRKAFDQYLSVITKDVPLTKEVAEYKEEALVQSVWPLLELPLLELPNLKKAGDIINFYKKIAFDFQSYRKALERLSKRLEFKKRNMESLEVSLELFRVIKETKGKREWFENFFNLAQANPKYEYPLWISKELTTMLLTGAVSGNEEFGGKEKLKYEEAFRFIITSQHKLVVSSKRVEDIHQVLNGYEGYLTIFSNSPRVIDMMKNKSELEFLGGKFVDAAYDYLMVYENPTIKQSKQGREYLISSLDASLKAMGEQKGSLLSKVKSRELYRRVAVLFKQKFPRDPKLTELDFNLAKSYYDDQKLERAAKEFIKFVKEYPNSEQTESAAVLALDCYYLQNKLNQLSKIGQSLLSINGLSGKTRGQIKLSVQQAQLKNVRSLAGDFSSKSYAAEFVAFAKKNKNSVMGEQALFEAFISLKSGTKEQAFGVGEEYMATYGDNPRAKDVLLQMSQLSLVLLDFVRAASYMATYGQKYPDDPTSKSLLEQAASLYSMSGKTDKTFVIYKMLGQASRGATVLSQWGQWSELERQASQISGLSGIYFQGLAQVRLGKRQEGMSMMKRAFSSPPSTPEEQEYWAHAGVMLMEDAVSQYDQLTKVKPFTMQALQAILEQQQIISTIAQSVIQQGVGIWKLAAISFDANISYNLSQFLKRTPPPSGFSADQFKKVVAPQIKQYETNAESGFASCLEVAEQNELASGFVISCRNRSFWSEVKENYLMRSSRQIASSNATSLRQKLKASPRSSELIRAYAVDRIENKDEPMALLMLTRARDLDPNSSEVDSLMSLAWLRLGAYSQSMASLKEAIAKDPNDPLAIDIKKTLFKKFGYKKKLLQVSQLKLSKKNRYIHLISN